MVNEAERLISSALCPIIPDHRAEAVFLRGLEDELEPVLLECLRTIIHTVYRSALADIYRDILVQILILQHFECINDILLAVIWILLAVSSGMTPFSIGGILAQGIS